MINDRANGQINALPARVFFTCPQIAAYWGYHPGTIARFVKEGRIPAVYIGKRPKIEYDVAMSLPDYIKPEVA